MEYLLEMRGIEKRFSGVRALKGVDIFVKPGEIHCLMGENGAGKSTLIKILAGAYSKDSGEIIFDGKKVEIKKPHDAQELGISFIFQELSVVNALTVEENMTLGYETVKGGFVNKKANVERVKDILKRLKIDIDAGELMRNLSVPQKQMVLIAKALSGGAKLIVMDEPTASLTNSESEELFSMMRSLKQTGVTFIYISHRFPDIFAIGDRITVFRDGENIDVLNVSETNEDEIIKKMVGRDIKDTFPRVEHTIGEEILNVKNLCASKTIKDISFSLHKGEILGVAGLAGAGKTELAGALFGDNKILGGQITLNGQQINVKTPKDAIRQKIALLPEERRSQGIVGLMSVRENVSMAASKLISKYMFVSIKKDKKLAKQAIDDMRVKTPSTEQLIQNLSGGNQQKVIIAKWLNTDADVILLDEPTRGIDVGAKSEIYDIIGELSQKGKSIIVFSSELPELIGVCDRIITLREGCVAGTLDRSEFSQERIMQYAIGGNV